MFCEISVLKDGKHITTCTLNATDSLDAIEQVVAEAKSWCSLSGEKEHQHAFSYEFQIQLIP